MANKFFQDMVTVKRAKEARDGKVYTVPVKKEQEPIDKREDIDIKSKQQIVSTEQTKEEETEKLSMVSRSSGHKPKYLLWIVAVVSVVFFLFALSFLFSKAVITVTPKTKDIVLNKNLVASKDSNIDEVSFYLVEISGEESKILQTTEQKDISQKATGVVVIYNSFSSASQLLSVDTRLEGSNGKVYKTLTKTTVPGKSNNGTPGSVEVSIYADQVGPEYNSGPMDFSIVGFKGTPKFTKFYARSKGEITGGLNGKFPSIAEIDKQRVVQELRTALQAKLLKKVTDQIPNGFILFKDAVFLNTDDNVDFDFSNDSNVPATLKGTLYGFLFDENKLTKKIAKDSVSKYDGSPVFIPNIKDLTFSLSNKDNISFGEVTDINFNLSGDSKIVWRVDAVKLENDLLGKSKKNFNQILLQYPNIESANLVVSPFWKMSIPEKLKDVNVIVNYPK